MSQHRAALRACYEEWRRMKLQGRTAGMVWRDFSFECLNRKEQ